MSQHLDARLARDMITMLRTRGAGSKGASAMAALLEKVAVPQGAVVTQLDSVTPFGQRFVESVKYLIAGVTPLNWFGPMQPLAPMADQPKDGTDGRRWDYQVGTNIQFIPRSEVGAGVSFPMLRNLADAYDLLRLVIEKRKDQICGLDWAVVPRDEKSDTKAEKDQVKRVSEFFAQPNPDQTWQEFLRAILEDMFVIDAVAIYPRMNRGSKLHSAIPIDGATIKRLIDAQGMTPAPGSPAFQQVLKGVPARDYTTDQLVYWMRNGRTHKLYGYGPVEQMIVTVNIALRRQQYLLEYYTEGNIPDAIIGVPESWTPDQIKEFQDYWDSILAGQTAVRRQMRFMPEVKNIILPKDAATVLTDETDEWLARILCFAFSITPAALLKMVNRAAGETMAESAKEDGLLPLLSWLAEKLTAFARKYLEAPDVRFQFKMDEEVDPKIKAETNSVYVKNAIMSVDEAREEAGMEPRGGNADELLVMTATGPIPLEESVERAREDAVNPPPPPPAFGAAPGEEPPNAPPPENGKPASGASAAASGGKGKAAPPKGAKVTEKHVHSDGGRLIKTMRAWRDPETGKLVGEVIDHQGQDRSINIDLGGVQVGSPAVKVVTPPVTVEAPPPAETFVNVDMTKTKVMPARYKTVTKTMKAKRDGKTGELFGEVTEKQELTQ